MRPGMDAPVLGAISASVVTTALCARLEFKTEVVFVWTGMHTITPTGSGDSLLDGNTFTPLVAGVVVDIGENTFTQSGSNELTITLAIPSSPELVIAAAQSDADEYRSRPATLWRAIKIETGDPLAPPLWAFRRIRAGSMDQLQVQADGSTHNLILTIESHQGRISNATNASYLNQRKLDPNDASQDHAPAIANGDPAPSKASPGGFVGAITRNNPKFDFLYE